MNFDTKHIMRWGIPGWYFILNIVLVVSFIFGFEWIISTQFIAPSIIITLMGVPLGYILYQPYFFLSNFCYKDYTLDWNLNLLKQENEDKRDFLSKRYAYLLTVIHGHGSLLSSISISILTIIIISCINHIFNIKIMWLLISNVLLFFIVFVNFTHYQKNIIEFIKKVLDKDN